MEAMDLPPATTAHRWLFACDRPDAHRSVRWETPGMTMPTAPGEQRTHALERAWSLAEEADQIAHVGPTRAGEAAAIAAVAQAWAALADAVTPWSTRNR